MKEVGIVQCNTDNCVIIFGGFWEYSYTKKISTRVIWTYNLCTEEWRKWTVEDKSDASEPFHAAVAAVIDGTIYTFGGVVSMKFIHRNALWTLSRTSEGCFTWRFIKPQDGRSNEDLPSPRFGHSGWEYGGNLWIFGGTGCSSWGYLNDHGNISPPF